MDIHKLYHLSLEEEEMKNLTNFVSTDKKKKLESIPQHPSVGNTTLIVHS